MDINIAILLSTYNSEKYLQEQIESLIKQSYSNWHLWVRDDRSTDTTLSILQNFQLRLVNKITILEDNMGNLGACKSFELLMKYCPSDYVMFCDHDDVWLPNKIMETLKLMLETEFGNKDKPILICTDLIVVDENLNVINPSMWKYMRNMPNNTSNIYELAVNNYVTGCTMMINRLAINCSLPFTSKTFMHDWWIALNVCRHGVIVKLAHTTILYRQHQSNVLGTQIVDGQYFIKRILAIKNIFGNNEMAYNMLKAIFPDFSLFLFLYTKIKVVFRKMLFFNK